MTDNIGRPLITDQQRDRIRQALAAIPNGKTGAVLVIADGESVRAQLAVNLNGHWKIAGGAGWILAEKRPGGWLAIEGSW